MAHKETPLMKQYAAAKGQHPGALLLFRVGDFYETFGEDAITASSILNITLTKRSNGAAAAVALAGFPHHALDNYLPKLVRAGQRVAICDQLEDPKNVKGIVKRGVTELVTPGVVYSDHVLEDKRSNYLCSLFAENQEVGMALADISTGEFLAAQGSPAYIQKLLQGFLPAEVIHSKGQAGQLSALLEEQKSTFSLEDWVYSPAFGYEQLTQQFNTPTLKGFGIEGMEGGIAAAGAILHYLHMTEHKQIDHLSSIARLEENEYVWLDPFTIRNLELITAQQEQAVPLISVLDGTLTPMGSRLLRKWMVLPLKNKAAIEKRLSVVAALHEDRELSEKLAAELQPIRDLERLISKVAAKRVNPRELLQLKVALQHLAPIKALLKESKVPALVNLAKGMDPCEKLRVQIQEALKDEVPLLSNLGGIFRDGIDPELDEWRKVAFSGKDYLVDIQQREIAKTGIPKIKIAYNKVFGYYLEVSHAQRDKVPEDWIRKQTLVNAERYVTPELKTYEEKIISAEAKIQSIESLRFQQLVDRAGEDISPIQQNAQQLATLDCLLSFATKALEHNYVKPQVDESKTLDIKGGRHPVIELQLPPGEPYIPNDVYLDEKKQQIIVVTGPNMAGKSALLRQVALITLMAQMGSFVPAKAAKIGLVDKVFTRVGAADNLSKGESTFMVEMTETASILNNLSDRSLVLMDEIGRGTSTYDGIAIAWSIVEYLHERQGARAKTLFATHYHELNAMEKRFERVKNYNVAVQEADGKVIFVRKLKAGGSEHSFGIHVAQMAGMPNEVVLKADMLMKQLAQDKGSKINRRQLGQVPKVSAQLSLFSQANPLADTLIVKLTSLDINRLSPVEALLQLNEIKALAAQAGATQQAHNKPKGQPTEN